MIISLIFIVTIIFFPDHQDWDILQNKENQKETVVFRFRCNRGFHLVGEKVSWIKWWSHGNMVLMMVLCNFSEHRTFKIGDDIKDDNGPQVSYCIGDSWSHEQLPVCASESLSYQQCYIHLSIHPLLLFWIQWHISSGNSCDQTSMFEIPYGEALSLLDGALYRSNPLLITNPYIITIMTLTSMLSRALKMFIQNKILALSCTSYWPTWSQCWIGTAVTRVSPCLDLSLSAAMEILGMDRYEENQTNKSAI